MLMLQNRFDKNRQWKCNINVRYNDIITLSSSARLVIRPFQRIMTFRKLGFKTLDVFGTRFSIKPRIVLNRFTHNAPTSYNNVTAMYTLIFFNTFHLLDYYMREIWRTPSHDPRDSCPSVGQNIVDLRCFARVEPNRLSLCTRYGIDNAFSRRTSRHLPATFTRQTRDGSKHTQLTHNTGRRNFSAPNVKNLSNSMRPNREYDISFGADTEKQNKNDVFLLRKRSAKIKHGQC